jgi:hypothetical protein
MRRRPSTKSVLVGRSFRDGHNVTSPQVLVEFRSRVVSGREEVGYDEQAPGEKVDVVGFKMDWGVCLSRLPYATIPLCVPRRFETLESLPRKWIRPCTHCQL